MKRLPSCTSTMSHAIEVDGMMSILKSILLLIRITTSEKKFSTYNYNRALKKLQSAERFCDKCC